MFDDDMFFNQIRKMFRNMPFEDDDIEALYENGDIKNGQPVVWGYQYMIGPDGIPRYSVYSNNDKIKNQLINRFGALKGHEISSNELPSPKIDADTEGYRSPNTDVVEDGDTLRVIVELPGVDKKEIETTAKENFLTIITNSAPYKYKAEIPLKVTTIPKKIKASFKNGILELKLPIVKKENQDTGDKVSIE